MARVGLQSFVIGGWYIQGDSGGKVNIFGGDSIGHCEKRKVCTNMCLIVNGYRDTAV